MAPPSTKPVLSKLNPEAVGLAAARAVVDRCAQFVAVLSPGVDLIIPRNADDDLRASTLAMSATDLCAWAQTGRGTHCDEVLDVITTVSQALYARAIDRGHYEIDDLANDVDPETEIGLVVQTAMTRMQILQGESVSLPQLARLASLSSRQLQELAAVGELTPEKNRSVAASEAMRWLSGRGVGGFAGKKR